MKIQSNFLKRTITGAVFVAMIVASIVSGYYIGAVHWITYNGVFIIVMSALWILMIFEYRKLLKENGTTEQKRSLKYSFFAYIYIILPFFCLIYTYHASFLYVLVLFVFIWINDTFAYLTGITIGKHKLWERVSPKKTWEGFFGGLVFTVFLAVALDYFTSDFLGLFHSLIEWIGFATVVVIAGTFGDLFESALKRSLNVKNSGTFLPGHGGLLDRLDSILFAAPAAMIYLMLVERYWWLWRIW
jgi:phosphatidate cytidylyltransferase